MSLLKLEMEVTEATLQQIEQLRGDFGRNEFLAHCLELGLIDYADEANRVQREALYMTMLNRTKDYLAARQLRTVAVRDLQPELPLQGSGAAPAGVASHFQGSSRRVTAA